ncbi:MAG: hypothetical protein KDJ16_08155 [Hyphomicrobiales bacterium]|nr:hypothetical protein [Hyphomicrobiales bacterium]
MEIVSLAHGVPATRLTNDETIDRMAEASKAHLSADEIAIAREHVGTMFSLAGAGTRHVTDGREQPIDLVIAAAEEALQRAGIAATELDFILYGGVTRHHVVPSCAAVIQGLLGATNSSCFDVGDACASWAQAMRVAESLLDGKSSGCGLVLTNETGHYEDCKAWEIPSLDRLKILAPALTLGEAATATVVAASAEKSIRFHCQTWGQYADLAVLPIVDPAPYAEIGLSNLLQLKFQADSSELTKQGLKAAIKTITEGDFFRDGPADWFVPHAGAEASVDAFLKITKFPVKNLAMTFREYGNTVTSSIPLGLSLATADGRIKRGDRVFIATAAAGISIVAAIFDY